MPKVSIIVPVYGVEQYIERCAISLFEQTYEDIEYIFVNDATPDKSMEVLADVIKRYPTRQKDVKIINHPQNRGISATRNTGLQATIGDYILYVDSDDYLALDAIEQLIPKALETNADVVIFDTQIVTQSGIQIDRVAYLDKESYIISLLQHTAKCAHWNKFYKAQFYRATNILADERVRFADDYAVTPRLVYEAEKIVVLHKPLYFYETTNQSSYVHNLSRTAIESQHRADKILTEFFADKEEFAHIVAVLPQRSLTSLIKNTDAEGWKIVAEVYQDCLTRSSKSMTLVNRIIFGLVKHKRWHLLQCFMELYHSIMRDRK